MQGQRWECDWKQYNKLNVEETAQTRSWRNRTWKRMNLRERKEFWKTTISQKKKKKENFDALKTYQIWFRHFALLPAKGTGTWQARTWWRRKLINGRNKKKKIRRKQYLSRGNFWNYQQIYPFNSRMRAIRVSSEMIWQHQAKLWIKRKTERRIRHSTFTWKGFLCHEALDWRFKPANKWLTPKAPAWR